MAMVRRDTALPDQPGWLIQGAAHSAAFITVRWGTGGMGAGFTFAVFKLFYARSALTTITSAICSCMKVRRRGVEYGMDLGAQTA